MSTLLLRLAAPMQSWGVASKFDTRDTAREPTKSGVIGLLAAALGISREDTEGLVKLKELNFGVRVDQPGVLLKDYHTAWKTGEKNPFVTNRYYLADAVFIVGLGCEKEFLEELIEALHHPVFPLYLGRRSCPPISPLVIGIREKSLYQALVDEPWQASKWFQNKHLDGFKPAIVCDAQSKEQGAFLRRDLPISFNQSHRQYGFRMAIDITKEMETNHDAFAGWGDE